MTSPDHVNMLQINEHWGNENEDSRSSANQSVTWKIFGYDVPRSEVVYICQMIIISCVILSCILNLSLKNGNPEMWVSFFGYAFGAMLPPPKIKKTIKNARNNPIEISSEKKEKN